MNALVTFYNYVSDSYKYAKIHFITTISFNLIYAFTQVQICLRRINAHLIANYPLYTTLYKRFQSKEPIHVFEFVKDGNVFLSYTRKQINNGMFNMPDQSSFDFYIYSEYTGNCTNKYIHTSAEKTSYVSQPSLVKFIYSEIKIDAGSDAEKIISISFKTDKYNYLMQNNVIDDYFIRYFMKKHYSYKHTLDNYELKLMDDSVKISKLDKNDRILILDDCFSVQTLELRRLYTKSDERAD